MRSIIAIITSIAIFCFLAAGASWEILKAREAFWILQYAFVLLISIAIYISACYRVGISTWYKVILGLFVFTSFQGFLAQIMPAVDFFHGWIYAIILSPKIYQIVKLYDR